jgi:hypothetical protein
LVVQEHNVEVKEALYLEGSSQQPNASVITSCTSTRVRVLEQDDQEIYQKRYLEYMKRCYGQVALIYEVKGHTDYKDSYKNRDRSWCLPHPESDFPGECRGHGVGSRQKRGWFTAKARLEAYMLGSHKHSQRPNPLDFFSIMVFRYVRRLPFALPLIIIGIRLDKGEVVVAF